MKKPLLLQFFVLCTLIADSAFGQSVNTEVATSINNIFGPLEKNRIHHNILLDMGMELIDINKYDGVLRSDNYASFGLYKDTYSTIISSCSSTGVQGIITPMQDEINWINNTESI
jgi:hypothetical protein